VKASGTSGTAVTVWEPKNHRGEARSRRRFSSSSAIAQASGGSPTTSTTTLRRARSIQGCASRRNSSPGSPTTRRALALHRTDLYLANRLWARIDRAVVDQAPVAPLFTLQEVDIVSSRVGNYQYQPQWGALLDQLWVR
jgi:hypothetical protein